MPAETTIADLDAWEVLDSRGRPTVSCRIELVSGASGTAAVPSGASTGSHEAPELRDGGPRYDGRGVTTAVDHVRGPLADLLRGRDGCDLDAVDDALAESGDAARWGANAVLAVSVAAALARARARGLPLYADQDHTGRPPLLPLPMVNVVSGGAHAGGAVDLQDVLVVPLFPDTFAGALELAVAVRAATARVAAARGYAVDLVADEGGLGPSLPSNREALDLVCAGIEEAGLRPGVDAALALDVAASELWDGGGYRLAVDGQRLDSAGMVDLVASWVAEFPVVSVEDALAEDDWEGWRALTRRLPAVQLVGDDLFVTDADRVARGVAEHAANAVLVKPNQTGLLSRARSVVGQAHDASWATVLSARSGETEDSWLADLTVGWRTGQIKVGSTTRSERTAKWNRLLAIEHRASGACYAGAAALGA